MTISSNQLCRVTRVIGLEKVLQALVFAIIIDLRDYDCFFTDVAVVLRFVFVSVALWPALARVIVRRRMRCN